MGYETFCIFITSLNNDVMDPFKEQHVYQVRLKLKLVNLTSLPYHLLAMITCVLLLMTHHNIHIQSGVTNDSSVNLM